MVSCTALRGCSTLGMLVLVFVVAQTMLLLLSLNATSGNHTTGKSARYLKRRGSVPLPPSLTSQIRGGLRAATHPTARAPGAVGVPAHISVPVTNTLSVSRNSTAEERMMDTDKKRDFMLFTSAGDKHNVHQWIGDERNYDIVVVYYGDTHFDCSVDALYERKDTKFPNLQWYMRAHSIDEYKAVAVWDDDIQATPSTINQLFVEMLNSQADVFSPCHTRGGKASLFKHNPSGWRYVEYIEMNAPMFLPWKLKDFIGVFDPIIKGWGTELWYGHRCYHIHQNCTMAVSDSFCVTNPKTRADGTREINKAQPEHVRSSTWARYAREILKQPVKDPPTTSKRGYDHTSKIADRLKKIPASAGHVTISGSDTTQFSVHILTTGERNISQLLDVLPRAQVFQGSVGYDASCKRILREKKVRFAKTYYGTMDSIEEGKLGHWCSHLRFAAHCVGVCMLVEDDAVLSSADVTALHDAVQQGWDTTILQLGISGDVINAWNGSRTNVLFEAVQQSGIDNPSDLFYNSLHMFTKRGPIGTIQDPSNSAKTSLIRSMPRVIKLADLNAELRTEHTWLVFTSAGDRSNVAQWYRADKDFDLMVVYYGDRDKYEYAALADRLEVRKDGKFSNLLHFYNSIPARYTSIFVLDDDIVMSSEDISALFRFREEYNVGIASPTFEPYHRGYNSLVPVDGSVIRYVDFVEMNTPMFRRGVLDAFMKVFDPVLKGWGADIWFAHVCNEDDACNLAVADEIHAHNPLVRANGKREIEALQPESERAKTWRAVAKKHNIPDSTGHATIPGFNLVPNIAEGAPKLFLCGYNYRSLKFIYPDRAVEKYSKAKASTANDIMLNGLMGPPCDIETFKGKIIHINGEPVTKVPPNTFGPGGHVFYYVQAVFHMIPDAQNLIENRTARFAKKFMYYVHRNCVQYREDAFDKFSVIKHVDALGACKNNKNGVRLKGTWTSNSKALAGYRFALCLENRKQPGYITEKILIAFVSGAIPVYYGTEEVFDIFNRNAFIYYDIENPEQAIAQVKYLEENPDKYKQMLKEPVLKDGAFEKYFAEEAIRNILTQKPTQTAFPTPKAPRNVYFITYGNSKYERAKKRIVKEAYNSNWFVRARGFGPEDLPKTFRDKYDHVLSRNRGGGYWIWKYAIIEETLKTMNTGDYLVYADAGCSINQHGKKRFDEYIDMLEASDMDIISFNMPDHQEHTWTTEHIFKYFNISANDQIRTSGQHIATVLILQKGPHLRQWLDLIKKALEEDVLMFTDEYNAQTKYTGFKDNRHDQSVLSVTRKIVRSIVIPDDTYPPNQKEFPIWASRLIDTSRDALQFAPSTANAVYVISLQRVENAHPSNKHRLDDFISAWEDVCGAKPEVNVCDGVLDDRRGFGVTQSFVTCLDQAMKTGDDYALFFEDDARLINSELCTGVDWSDAPADAFLVMFGGHAWKYADPPSEEKYRKTLGSYGLYGFMVPVQNMETLRAGWNQELATNAATLSPDVSWYKHAAAAGKSVYARDPLLVWHEGGYSNTWHTHRNSIDAPGTHRVSGTQQTPEMHKPMIAICAATHSQSTWRTIEDTALQQLLIPSIEKTISSLDRSTYAFHLYLAADHDDPFWLKNENSIQTPDWLSVHVGFYELPQHKIPFNPMLRAAYNDGAEYMVRVNDDSEFVTSDWVSKTVAKLASYDPPNVGMVGPDCREGNTAIMTHDMVHRTHLDIFEHYYPDVFSAWWIDDWMSKVYGPERSTKMLDWTIEHHTHKHGRRYEVQHQEAQLIDGELDKGAAMIEAWLARNLRNDTKVKHDAAPRKGGLD